MYLSFYLYLLFIRAANESQDYPQYRRSWRNVSDDDSFSLTILFASSSTDLHENAPGDYRFIDGGEVCFFCGRSVEEKYR